MGDLRKFFASQLVGVVAGYRSDRLVAAVAAVALGKDDRLVLDFPKRNPFRAGEKITIHLDDRQGSEVYSIELRVHRVSYKGVVTAVSECRVWVDPVDYELVYGSRLVAQYRASGYSHAAENRPSHALGYSDLSRTVLADEGERSNKLGILATYGADRPHTTVMAFLSSSLDDVFLITQPSTYKFQNLLRRSDCVFAMDHRATFSFERQVDWNYTIYEAKASLIPPSHRLFAGLRDAFVEKNPWEEAFFRNPETVMIHLKPQHIVQQDVLELS